MITDWCVIRCVGLLFYYEFVFMMFSGLLRFTCLWVFVYGVWGSFDVTFVVNSR